MKTGSKRARTSFMDIYFTNTVAVLEKEKESKF